MRLLLVEDNRQLSLSLRLSLEEAGYAVDAAYDGPAGEVLAAGGAHDLIVLDILLPGLDGLQLCRALRRQGVRTPILMLTARDTVDDRVRGLDSGADDYLIKPFALRELQARLRALLRRESAADAKSGRLCLADLALDPATHSVERAGRPISLTAREFALLEYFLRNPGRLITRQMAEDHVWSYDFLGGSNVVDVTVRRLRRKIDDPFPLKLIETVRGLGYRLSPPEAP
jgi:DNA-binding response OmpR family regulator